MRTTSPSTRFALADGWEEILRAHVARTQDTDAALWLLAWDGPEPVGLLAVEAHQNSPLFRHREWAELAALYVAPSWRRTGLARRLVDQARGWAVARGFDCLQLYVTATNEPARRLYARCGLRPVQEIWRLDGVPQLRTPQPADLSCAASQRENDLLEPGQHHQLMDAAGRAEAV